MRFVLTHRYHTIRRISVLLLIAVMVISLLGCDPRNGEYPENISQEWTCEQLPFVLSYDIGPDGKRIVSHVLEWENKPVCVKIGMHSSQYDVYPIDATYAEAIMFSGEWRYRGEKLVLSISDDDFFGDGRSSLEFISVEKQKKTQLNTIELTATVAGVQIIERKDGVYLAIQPWGIKSYFLVSGNVSSNVDLEALRTIRGGDKITVRVDANKQDYLNIAEFVKIYSLATEDKTIFTIDDYNEWISK